MQTVGGLVTALDPVMRATKGLWIAWKRGEDGEKPKTVGDPSTGAPYALQVIPVSEREAGGYYDGFANRALWPMFHGFTGRARFEDEEWEDYRRVNDRFSAGVVAALRDGDVVWIHDYQLMLVPEAVRRNDGRGTSIGYFHHIPFPAIEIFRTLPWAKDVLRGLLGAELVGFHTASYAHNFLRAVETLLPEARVDHRAQAVAWHGRVVRVGAFPIGIDVERVERFAAGRETKRGAQRWRSDWKTEALIVGVDRLDYTKGIEERVLAMERFFERHPAWRRRVSLVQIAAPSRTRVEEYRRMKRALDEAIGRVNGRFTEPGWTPIRYINRSLDFSKLVPLYVAADVALITPLRDGMNLVAMEYVASRVDGGGALILSDQAGASETLRDAWQVNPRHLTGVADTIAEALESSPEERRRRMESLREQVRRGNVHRWLESYLDALLEAPAAERDTAQTMLQ